MPDNRYLIYSNSSKHSEQGWHIELAWTNTDILIAAAQLELKSCGQTLQSMAGIPCVEAADGHMEPMRRMTLEEMLALSIQKLGDNARLCRAFATDPHSEKVFLATAQAYGLERYARTLVETYSPNPQVPTTIEQGSVLGLAT